MNAKYQQAVWVAAAGVALQLIGLSWDAVMHSMDPTLAEREGVFTLSNPSHLFIMLGLGLTVGGVVWGLTGGFRALSTGNSTIARASSATLIAVIAVAGGLAVATGAVTEQGGHSHDEASAAHDHDLPVDDPIFASLQVVLRDSGTQAALDQLEALAAVDRAILGEGHNYAHSLGRYAYEVYGGAPAAFESCRELFQSGCYHGVLEEYFLVKGSITPADVAGLCGSQIRTDQSLFVKFQCVHGLGHGLTMFLDHDLFKALGSCDYLSSDWDRQSCYGGAFMENIIFAQQPHPAGHSHGDHQAALKREDPHYPCSAVAETYKFQCYLMQTSVMLWYNGYDYGDAARSCGQAPAAYVATCFMSLGRDISGATLRDADKSVALCQQGPVEFRSFCYIGAVKNFIDVTWTTDEGMVFCGKVPDESKAACYQAIGEQVAGIYPDMERRAMECARMEPAYVAACQRGAGVATPAASSSGS